MSSDPVPHAAPPDTGSDSLPPRTTPTWEMELLLSGATVFALFQAYAATAPLGQALPTLVHPDVGPLVYPLLAYFQAGLLGLSMGFLCHLLLRGMWIALVGMYSVDPKGDVRHSPTLGPWQRSRVAATWDDLPKRIAALDDTATVVFAMAIGFARLMAQLFLLAGVMVLGAGLVSMLSDGRFEAQWVVLVLLGVLLGPFMLSVFLDNRAGRRGTATPAIAVRVLGVYDRLGMTSQHNLSLLMAAHRMGGRGSRTRSNLFVFAVIAGVMFATALLPHVMRNDLGALLRGGFPRLAVGDANTLRAVHYADRLPRDAYTRLPQIPAELVDGDYLRLFIPFAAEWHDAALRNCAASHGAAAWRETPQTASVVLQCIAARQPLTLNGQPLTAPWLLAEDQRRDRRGFVVMIDVQALPRGMHELAVAQVPEAAEDEDGGRAWRIPFWK